MELSNNLNTMNSLQNNLNSNATQIAKAGTINATNLQENLNKELPDITEALVEQTMIPIAYTAQAKVIEVQDATEQTLLDMYA